jgi:membrane protein implicated in regulation of membrane protease activity
MVYGKEDESKIPQFVSHNVVTLIVLPISIALSYFIGLSFIGFMVASYMLFILRIVIDFFVNPFLKRRQSKNRGNNKLVNKNNTTKR